MPVLLALAAALAYGASDFVGGLVSRRTAPWSVSFVALGSGRGLLDHARPQGRFQAPGESPLADGVLDGVLAGVGFGGLFVALAQVPAEAGFWPLALHQVVATLVVAALGTGLSQRWLLDRTALLGGLVPGVLAASATGAFLVATQGGLLSVTAVLTSLYPAVTVLLALLVLREGTHSAQRWGLLLCGVAVGLVAAG